MLLVLWDVDGTLVDSAGHGRRAFEDAFESVVGRPLTEAVEFAGRTDHQIAVSMLAGVHGADDQLEQLLAALVPALERRKELIRSEGRVYAGVAELLASIEARPDLAQSLLTGNLEANAVVKLAAFGLDRWFDFGVGAYGSDPHEDRSDLVAIARERAEAKLGEPMEPVLVGDTPLDVEAARQAGARSVAVMTGFASEEELRASRPDVLLPDLSDTERALEAITRR